MVLSVLNKKFKILPVNEERPLHFILLLQNKGKFKNSVDFGAEPEVILQT
jgi:hypothetical protein